MGGAFLIERGETMSLSGNAEAGAVLRGKVATAEAIHGYSAYETAVINGFDGTEEEWLASLKGAKGDSYILTDADKEEIADMASPTTPDGTVVSQNADFAEVAEWADGNPNNEDRTGYFVCANVPVNGIVMKKATSIDDVKGVTILAPAFAGNFTKDKLDSNGNLLPKYSYVAIIGFVPVRDNGTCEVGGRCMPDDNGCAIPSSNNMGYQVVNRIDENRILIIIEPNGDMVQRVKARITELQEDVDNINEKTEWKTVLDTTLTAEQGGVTSLLLALSDAEAVANARRMRLHIAFPQKEALAVNKAWLSVNLQDKTASAYSLRLLGGYNVAASANTTLYSMAFVEISDFGLTNVFKRSFVSVQQLPNPHYTASANSSANARIITGGYSSDLMVEYPPYLNITIGNVTAFNAGTKVFVEVQ